MGQGEQQWIGTLISVGILVIVLAVRMRKMSKAQPLKIERLWILPALYAGIAAVLYYTHPPQGMVWLYALGALAVGLLLGWYRGKLMAIHVHPETHEVSQQGSMAAMLFIVVLVGVRFVARSLIGAGTELNPSVMFSVTDVLLAFGLGFIAAQRLEMGMRAKELLIQARAASR